MLSPSRHNVNLDARKCFLTIRHEEQILRTKKRILIKNTWAFPCEQCEPFELNCRLGQYCVSCPKYNKVLVLKFIVCTYFKKIDQQLFRDENRAENFI